MDNKTAFDRLEGEKNAVTNKVKGVLSEYLVYFLLFFALAVQIVSKLYTVNVQNIITPSYILGMVTSITITMLVYIVFVPTGSQKELERSDSFHDNMRRWGELSANVRNGRSDPFTLYCRRREESEREERRREIITNGCLMDFEKYKRDYLPMSKKQLRSALKKNEITQEEYSCILKANRTRRVKPINPLLILCGVERYNINDAGRKTRTGISKKILSRPFIILATNILLNSINPVFQGLNNADAVYAMLLSCLSTILSAYAGYVVGVEQIKRRNEIVKNRIFFIENFEEDQKKNANIDNKQNM